VEPERVLLSAAGERVALRLPRPGTRPAPPRADSTARVRPDSSPPPGQTHPDASPT
jgi:hypothetical protein